MKTKKLRYLALVLVLVMLTASFIGCQKSSPATDESGSTAPAGSSESAVTTGSESGGDSGKVRTVAEREDALDGEPVTPSNFTVDMFPGLSSVGVKPEKKYFIAFSNGEMGNAFCRTFFDDMVETGEKYAENFGIRFEYANAGNNSTKQLSDVQSLLAKSPDALIISANEAEPLSVIYDWCEQSGTALITVDKELEHEPGTGKYISAITMDCYLNGIGNGLAVVKALTEKYGEPRGTVVEIAGILGASPSYHRSQGLNWVLKDYPNINIIASRPGEWDPKISYTVAQDLLTTYKEGEIDFIVASCDESALAFMEAAKGANRYDEFKGMYAGCDGTVAFLEKILQGEAFQSSEFTPYFATHAFEYAINYLNGVDIPTRIPIPQRHYRADTPERKDKLQELVDYCKANSLEFVPITAGGNAELAPDADVYKIYEEGGVWNVPKYLEEVKPYVTSESAK
jgi:ribose transport system substrate-binding protein